MYMDRPTDRPTGHWLFLFSFFFFPFVFSRGRKIGAACARVDEGGCVRMRVRVRVSLGGVGEKASSWVSGYR